MSESVSTHDRLLLEALTEAALLTYCRPDPHRLRDLARRLRGLAKSLDSRATVPEIHLPVRADAGVAAAKYLSIATYTLLSAPDIAAQASYAAATILMRSANHYKRPGKTAITPTADIIEPLKVVGQVLIVKNIADAKAACKALAELAGPPLNDDEYTVGRLYLTVLSATDPVEQLLMQLLSYIVASKEDYEAELSYALIQAAHDTLFAARNIQE